MKEPSKAIEVATSVRRFSAASSRPTASRSGAFSARAARASKPDPACPCGARRVAIRDRRSDPRSAHEARPPAASTCSRRRRTSCASAYTCCSGPSRRSKPSLTSSRCSPLPVPVRVVERSRSCEQRGHRHRVGERDTRPPVLVPATPPTRRRSGRRGQDDAPLRPRCSGSASPSCRSNLSQKLVAGVTDCADAASSAAVRHPDRRGRGRHRAHEQGQNPCQPCDDHRGNGGYADSTARAPTRPVR